MAIAVKRICFACCTRVTFPKDRIGMGNVYGVQYEVVVEMERKGGHKLRREMAAYNRNAK